MKQVIQFSATDGYFYSPGFVAGLIQLCGGNGLVDAGASRQKANRGDNCQQNADDEDNDFLFYGDTSLIYSLCVAACSKVFPVRCSALAVLN